jgi:hypothetical protein
MSTPSPAAPFAWNTQPVSFPWLPPASRQPGQAAFASTFAVNFGGYTEYKCLPETGVLALKPDNLSYEEAAAVPECGDQRRLCH